MQMFKAHQTMLAIVVAMAPVAAVAGPCSDEIATIGRQLSQDPSLGPATTGALTGSGPGSMARTGQAISANKAGTSADNRVGGTAGTKELDAASSNVATSDADVRQQQLGRPTAAAQASAGGGIETTPGKMASSSTDDHMSRAKMAWQKAVDLNAQNDSSCKGAVAQARAAMKAS